MPMTLAEIEEQARQLSAEDRARLAEAMLDSLHESPAADVLAMWDREMELRIAELERGETETFPAEDVFAEARDRSTMAP